MRRHPRSIAILATLLVCAGGFCGLEALAAADSDWPQWRGPQRNGKSPDTGLLAEWPAGGPPLVFRAAGLGTGYSSLSVAGNRIYTMGDLADGQYVMALDRKRGKLLWKTLVGERHEDDYPGPRSTPTVDGNRVYALGTGGKLVCLNAANGAEVWSRSLPGDFGGRLMMAKGQWNWRFAESPLVDGDRVVVTPGDPQAALVALDKKTGEEIWRAAIPALGERGEDGAGYSSVVVSEAGGVRQYVQLLGRGVVGVEARTGRFLWGYNRVANEIANIPTPIVHGDFVFASSGYGTGSALLRLKRDGEAFRAEEVYFLEAQTMQNHHGGIVLHDGTIYTGTGHNKGFPLAVDFQGGKVAWGPVRNKGESSAAVSYADGRLYFRYQNGLMVLVEASSAEYREKGSFMIPDVERESWAHPVIAGGLLYLREQDKLFVYDLRAGRKKPEPKPAAKPDKAGAADHGQAPGLP